jgi:transcriptional regulator with XRE-family HTH domain
MNGSDIRAARLRLTITQAELARIFVVDQTTIYRWEALAEARIDPLHRELALLLVGVSASPNAAHYGAELVLALEEGPAFALHVLLSIAYNDWSPNHVRTPTTATA